MEGVFETLTAVSCVLAAAEQPAGQEGRWEVGGELPESEGEAGGEGGGGDAELPDPVDPAEEEQRPQGHHWR